jgi:hypothetical protein
VSIDEPFAERQIQAAVDESICREENERTEERSSDSSQPTQYRCECVPDCATLVPLTVGEYEEVRKVPTHFVIAPGHLVVGVEVVVRETSRYQVVEKIGAAAPMATRLDPREDPEQLDAAWE